MVEGNYTARDRNQDSAFVNGQRSDTIFVTNGDVRV